MKKVSLDEARRYAELDALDAITRARERKPARGYAWVPLPINEAEIAKRMRGMSTLSGQKKCAGPTFARC